MFTWHDPQTLIIFPSGHQIACTLCRMWLHSLPCFHCDLHNSNIAGLYTPLCCHKLHERFISVPIPVIWEVSNVHILRRVYIFIVYPWNKILMQLAGKIDLVASPSLTSSKTVCWCSLLNINNLWFNAQPQGRGYCSKPL